MAQEQTNYQPTNIELRESADWPNKTLLSSVDWPDVQFTYYVVSGAEPGGDGSRYSPFSLPAEITVLSAGDSVSLTGSWKGVEGFASGADNITVVGDGAVLDGSAVALNASFTKTGGRTNVYQITVAYAANVGDYPNAWEDDVFLKAAADLSACDSTPGTRFFDSGVMYVHPYGSTNPISDGKVYEYSAASVGIELTGSGCTIRGVAAGRQGRESGPFQLGDNGTLEDFETFDTSRHALVAGPGSSVIAPGKFGDMYWDTYTAGGFLVFFKGVLAGETCTVSGAIEFECSEIDRCNVAVDSHNGTSGSLALVRIEGNPIFTLCNTGIGCANCDLVEIDTARFVDVLTPITPFGSVLNATGITHTNTIAGAGQRLVAAGNDDLTVTIENSTVNLALGVGLVRSTGDNLGLTLTNVACTIGASGGFPISAVTIKDGSLRVRQLDYNDANGQYGYVTGAVGPFDPVVGTVTIDSDFNDWTPDSLTWIIEGVSYSGLAAYQSATGQDQNSV